MPGVAANSEDQARGLRELVRSSAPAVTLAIAGGKGGVGKTNVAVNLALCLSARGRRVTLLDLDMGMADADLLLGVHASYNLAHVLSGLRDLEEVGVRLPGGARFISGTSGIGRLANLSNHERSRLLQQMQPLEADNDYLVLDCGAGISRNVITFALAAGAVVLVTTPEPTALADTYATIKVLARERYSGTIHLLVNMASDQAEARRAYERVADVSTKFLKYPIADGGYLLQDRHVELAVRNRIPFVSRFPKCPATSCLMAIASRLDAGRNGVSRRGGFFERVVGLFA
ncbi:MAG: MinD/ParA family protein [bacterium]|nr:MinD/ParA family protein [bacterium]